MKLPHAVLPLLVASLICFCGRTTFAAEALTVASDFEGGSVKVIEISEAARSISFTPGGDAARGWPCWWYFQIRGITPGETITLRLRGSDSTVALPGKPAPKPLEIGRAHV